MNLHTRSICDACHDALATIERRGCWLCASCDGSTIPFSLPSDASPDVNAPAAALSPTVAGAILSEIPGGDRQTVAAASPPASQDAAAAVDPGPCGWASTDLESALASETMADGDHWPATADPADPVVVDFEAEIATLEAGWLRDGIKFYDPNGVIAAPTQGQAFFYCGIEVEKFCERFEDFGFLVVTAQSNKNPGRS